MERQYGAIPVRIRGRLGQAEAPPEMIGKWFVDISMWDLDGKEEIGPLGQFGPFDTEAIAGEKCQELCKAASRAASELVSGESCDVYFDMKDGGRMKDWSKLK